MKRFISLFFMFLLSFASHGKATSEMARDAEVASSSLAAATATALAKADVALARSFIVQNNVKGCFGESIAEKVFLDTYLTKEGHWQSITPRSGPQGLDHLFIKTRNGVITDLMVGESKYNTASLNSNTSDGVQMGPKWIATRLRRLAWRYTQVSALHEIGFGKPPLNPVRKLCVVLKNGKKVFFWAEGRKWYFSGTAAELTEARTRAAQYGSYFDKGANGYVKYRSRLFNIVPKGNDIEIRIYDAKNIANGSFRSAKPTGVLRIKGALLTKDAISETELASQIQKKLGLSDADSLDYARKILAKSTVQELLAEYSLCKSLAINSAMATAISVPIDAVIQLIATHKVDPVMLSLDATGVFLGTTGGQLTHLALTRPAAYNTIKSIVGPLRCSAPMATSALSSMAGGLITSAIISYSAWALGYGDLKTANRGMIIGTTASGAGALVPIGAMWVATTYGTAGTGAAISSLSGAAASNAALAWLGGGTVASGGGGMAAGAMVLTGGAAIVVTGVAVAGYYIYKMYDQQEETKRICEELDWYQREKHLDSVLQTDRRYNMLCR